MLMVFRVIILGLPIPGVLIFIQSISRNNNIKINNYTDENGVFENNDF
jgi:hypothetical protein